MYLSIFRGLNYERIHCLISIVGVVVCLVPLVVLYSNRDGEYSMDDVALYGSTYLDISPSLLSSFYISLIPFVDVSLDFYQNIWHWFNDKKPCTKKGAETVIYRLTDKEKSVFVCGIIIQGVVCLLPDHVDYSTITAIYITTCRVSTIMLLSPILLYLKRVTTTFTPLVTASILMSLVTGAIIASLKMIYRFDQLTYRRMQQSRTCFMAFTGLLFIATTMACFIFYCIEKNFAPIKPCDKQNTSDVNLTHYIPALHMISFIIIGTAMVLRSNKLFNDISSSDIWYYIYYFLLFGETMVLVVEMRIRQNEIARGLVRL